MPFLLLVFPNLSPSLGSHPPLQPAWPQRSLLGQQDQWAHQAVVTMATGARQVGAQVGPPSVSPPRQPCCLRPAQPSPGWHYHHPSLRDSPVSGPLFLASALTGDLALPPGQTWVWVLARFPKGSRADHRRSGVSCIRWEGQSWHGVCVSRRLECMESPACMCVYPCPVGRLPRVLALQDRADSGCL